MWCSKYPIGSCCTKASRVNRQCAVSATHATTLPRWPMKNTFSIPAFTERWRTCSRQPIRCTCIMRPGLEGSSTAAPASILHCYAAAAAGAACCCFLCYRCCGLACCQLLVRTRIRFSSIFFPLILLQGRLPPLECRCRLFAFGS